MADLVAGQAVSSGHVGVPEREHGAQKHADLVTKMPFLTRCKQTALGEVVVLQIKIDKFDNAHDEVGIVRFCTNKI